MREQVKRDRNSTPELYNLARDPGETANVAQDNPGLAAKAAALMKAARSPSSEPQWNF
ncbi:MAG: hypothetical protein SH850_20295 [Planctomycetaceae bacterium]|nr:hypothetical protein [Planctomycetaceae bacterium]